jgi:hypothetical protein
MAAQRLRRDVVAAAAFPTMRAAARCLLVSAEVALATRLPEQPAGDIPVMLSVPDIHEQVFRLKTAKRVRPRHSTSSTYSTGAHFHLLSSLHVTSSLQVFLSRHLTR